MAHIDVVSLSDSTDSRIDVISLSDSTGTLSLSDSTDSRDQLPVRNCQAPGPQTQCLPAQDCDSYNVTVFPADLLRLYSPESALALAPQVPQPLIKDHPYFREWVWAARALAYFRIEPCFKQPLVDYLNARGLTVVATDFEGALTRGGHPLLMALFVEALQRIGCRAVRVLVYGIKHPLDAFDMEPANPTHPLAYLNSFDLGRVTQSDSIQLVRRSYSSHQRFKEYPMFLDIGQGFGSINTAVTYAHKNIQVKVYPRYLHSIKSVSRKHVQTWPKTLGSARQRFRTVKTLLCRLQQVPIRGGLRLEASIQALTLREAREFIAQTPLLNLDEWLQPTMPLMRSYKLIQLQLQPDDALSFAEDIWLKAEALPAFRGNDHHKPSARQQRILQDCLNALGYNPRGTGYTTWHDPHAWWKHVVLPQGGVPLPVTPERGSPEAEEQDTEAAASRCIQVLPPVAEVRRFFALIREQHTCPACNATRTSNLDGGRTQFRLRCKTCGTRSSLGTCLAHWEVMIASGRLTGVTVVPGAREVRPAREARPAREVQGAREVQTAREAQGAREVRPAREARPAREVQGAREARPAREVQGAREVQTAREVQGAREAQTAREARPAREVRPVPSPQPHPVPNPTLRRFQHKPLVQVTFDIQPATLRLGGRLRATDGFIPGNGNCQFTAIGYHHFGHKRGARVVRLRVADWLQHHHAFVAQFAAAGDDHLSARDYVQRIRRPGEWGDELSVAAASHALQLPLAVASQTATGLSWSYYPDHNRPAYHGLFHNGNHYELLFIGE